jgi:hypothetical protein
MSDAIVTKPPVPEGAPIVKRILWKRFALALVVAGVSDAVAFAVALIPPAQIALDFATALVLFFILGRRWALLPGLAAEAIPGMGIFPVWILVVLSIFLYDDIKLRKALR